MFGRSELSCYSTELATQNNWHSTPEILSAKLCGTDDEEDKKNASGGMCCLTIL